MNQFMTSLDNVYLFRFDTLTQNFYVLDLDWESENVNCYDEQGSNYTFDMSTLKRLADQGRLSYWQLIQVDLAGVKSAKMSTINEMLTQQIDDTIKTIVDLAKD